MIIKEKDDIKTHLRRRLRALSFLLVGTSLTLEGSLRTPLRESRSCRGIVPRRPLLFLRWFRLFERVNLLASKSIPAGRVTSVPLLGIVPFDASVFIIVGTAAFTSPKSFSHGDSQSSSEMVSKLLGPTDEVVLSDMMGRVNRAKERKQRNAAEQTPHHFVTLDF